MTERFYAGGYWDARRESAQECAIRSARFFDALRVIDPVFSTWYAKAGSRRAAMREPVDLGEAALERALAASVKRGHAIPDVGFSLALWTGGDEGDAAAVQLTCGSGNPYVGNACVLDLPWARPFDVEPVVSIVRAMADAWSPDVVNVNSATHRSMSGRIEGETAAGWVLYVSSERGAVPSLPPPARVLAGPNGGTIVITTEERFSSSNPDHVAAAERVAATLERAGILRPA